MAAENSDHRPVTILRRAYSESVREATAWQASDEKIKKWKLKGLVHSRRAKDQLSGLLAAFALTRYSRRLNQDVFVVQASCPALAGFPREDGPIKEGRVLRKESIRSQTTNKRQSTSSRSCSRRVSQRKETCAQRRRSWNREISGETSAFVREFSHQLPGIG